MGWFILIGALAAGALGVGRWIGLGGEVRSRCCVLVCVLLVLAWGWLVQSPSVAVQVMPLSMLACVEGVFPVPAYMLIVGVLWGRATKPRQRRLAGLATALGVIYFVTGGMWMVQRTPSEAFASSTDGILVRQSQDYSCVAASCATALGRLGVATSEAEMAVLTRTRPGTGSTMIRAFEGLRQRLRESGSRYRAELISVPAQGLQTMPMPLVTKLRFTPTSHHMVTVLEANDRTVMVADPDIGLIAIPRGQFDRFFSGDVIVFSEESD